jgi:tRNA(His) 5'-end guanylyltransferase
MGWARTARRGRHIPEAEFVVRAASRGFARIEGRLGLVSPDDPHALSRAALR